MAKVVTIEIEAKIDEANKKIEGLEKKIEDLEGTAKEAADGVSDISKSVKGLSKQFLNLGNAIKASGIAIFIQLLSSAKDAFAQTQEVADFMSSTFQTVAFFINGVVKGFKDGEITFGNFFEKLSDIASTSVTSAQEFVKLQNQALLNNAELEFQQLEFQRRAEEQRQIRDDISRGLDERLEANEKLGEILKEQTDAELKLAQAGVERARILLEQNDSVENQVQAWEALTKLSEIQERVEAQTSEQLTNQNALLQEREEIFAESRKSMVHVIGAFKGTNAQLIESNRDRLMRELEDEEHFLNLRKEKLNSYTLEYQQINARLSEISKERQISEIETERLLQQERLNIANQTAQSLAGLAQTLADFSQFLAEDVTERDREEAIKRAKIAKALAISTAVINTAMGVTSIFAGNPLTPFPVKVLQAASVLATGIAQVSKIEKTPLLSGSGGSDAGGGISDSTGGGPSSNVTIQAAGGADLQLQRAIRLQNSNPQRAYVVSSDVTTQQSLDRRIGTEVVFGG